MFVYEDFKRQSSQDKSELYSSDEEWKSFWNKSAEYETEPFLLLEPVCSLVCLSSLFFPVVFGVMITEASECEYDYESLGGNSTAAQNAIAGALAGIGEHCLMYPIDSIKVRTHHGLQ